VGREVYRHLGRCLGEALGLSRLTREWVETNVRFVGEDAAVEGALASGPGRVMVVSHFGNWELHGASWALKGRPVAAVPSSNRIARWTPWCARTARRAGCGSSIPATRARWPSWTTAGRQDRGHLADQNRRQGRVRLPFFGRDCSVAKAPAVLARKTGAALIPAFLVRENGRHLLRTTPFP
jgi:KDO2-lipid IV(A) lauroyltransferase